MKKIIFVLVVIVFCSCEKELDKVPGGIDWIQEEFHIKDTIGLNRLSASPFNISEKEKGLIAIKNEKVWIGVFDVATKEEKQSWTGEKPITEKINNIDINHKLILEDGYAFLSSINTIAGAENAPRPRIGLFIVNNRSNNIFSYDFSSSDKLFSLLSDMILLSYSTTQWADVTKKTLITTDGKLFVDDVSLRNIGDSLVVTGFNKDNKIWFGIFNSEKKKIEEWNSKESIERNIKIHLGYGEYKDIYINRLLDDYSECMVVKTPWGYAVCADIDQEYESKYYKLFLLNQKQVFSVDISNNNETVIIREWYDNSIMHIKQRESFVYTSIGGLLYSFKPTLYSYTGQYGSEIPCSYTDFIQNYKGANESGLHEIYRYNLSENKHVWRCQLSFMAEIPYSAKSICNLLNNESEIWQFLMDITYYDGTKKAIYFSININNGELKVL